MVVLKNTERIIESINDYFIPKGIKYKTGVIAGGFEEIDLNFLKESRDRCEDLWILIKNTPNDLETVNKIRTFYDPDNNQRSLIYNEEQDLIVLLETLSPDIRFLEKKYEGKIYPGFKSNLPVIYLDF
jgi:hypothetical protein